MAREILYLYPYCEACDWTGEYVLTTPGGEYEPPDVDGTLDDRCPKCRGPVEIIEQWLSPGEGDMEPDDL